ncbi:hypothetical protein DP56_6077 [Burkholderia pseudomallei]|nr:hypothetical protein DP56_6077 [Burkholderia pseudomallei]
MRPPCPNPECGCPRRKRRGRHGRGLPMRGAYRMRRTRTKPRPSRWRHCRAAVDRTGPIIRTRCAKLLRGPVTCSFRLSVPKPIKPALSQGRYALSH